MVGKLRFALVVGMTASASRRGFLILFSRAFWNYAAVTYTDFEEDAGNWNGGKGHGALIAAVDSLTYCFVR